jgi:hypothetical protein
MTDLVPAENIERIVGTLRHPTLHYGHASSSEQTVYILHSQECLDSGIDLRDCAFSVALDEGIDVGYNGAPWTDFEDVPVPLTIWRGRLIPRID